MGLSSAFSPRSDRAFSSSASGARRPSVGNPDLSRDTRLLSAPNPLLRRTPSSEDQELRKPILRQNMEGFSLSMSSDTFNEEWMEDLEEADIKTKHGRLLPFHVFGHFQRGMDGGP